MTAHIYILHATEWEGIPFLSGPKKLQVAYGYAPEHPMDLMLEHIFRQNNAVDGTERNVERGARSLSVGDVVLIDRGERVNTWVVDTIGFMPIETEALAPMLEWE